MHTTIFGSYVLVTLDLMSIAYVILSIRPWLPHFSSDMVVRMPAVTVTIRGRSFKLFFFFFYRHLFGTWISALTGSTSMPWGKSSAAIFQSDIVRMRSVIVLLCPLCIFLCSLQGLLLFFVKPKLHLFATLLFFLHWCVPWSPRTPPLDLQ